MPFIRLKRTWSVQMRTMHQVHLHLSEGFVRDRLRLYVDEDLVLEARPSFYNMKGLELFEIDGREVELRWLWSFWTGNPESIVLVHKGHLLAQVGSDRALDDSLFTD